MQFLLILLILAPQNLPPNDDVLEPPPPPPPPLDRNAPENHHIDVADELSLDESGFDRIIVCKWCKTDDDDDKKFWCSRCHEAIHERCFDVKVGEFLCNDCKNTLSAFDVDDGSMKAIIEVSTAIIEAIKVCVKQKIADKIIDEDTMAFISEMSPMVEVAMMKIKAEQLESKICVTETLIIPPTNAPPNDPLDDFETFFTAHKDLATRRSSSSSSLSTPRSPLRDRAPQATIADKSSECCGGCKMPVDSSDVLCSMCETAFHVKCATGGFNLDDEPFKCGNCRGIESEVESDVPSKEASENEEADDDDNDSEYEDLDDDYEEQNEEARNDDEDYEPNEPSTSTSVARRAPISSGDCFQECIAHDYIPPGK